jgi:hypothetical protein
MEYKIPDNTANKKQYQNLILKEFETYQHGHSKELQCQSRN